jgi:hypothetical protein
MKIKSKLAAFEEKAEKETKRVNILLVSGTILFV